MYSSWFTGCFYPKAKWKVYELILVGKPIKLSIRLYVFKITLLYWLSQEKKTVIVILSLVSSFASSVECVALQLILQIFNFDLTFLAYHLFSYVMTADLEKMYREIKDVERWPYMSNKRFSRYLVTRTFNQSVNIEESSFPHASEVIKNNIYTDDVHTGTNTVEEGPILQE